MIDWTKETTRSAADLLLLDYDAGIAAGIDDGGVWCHPYPYEFTKVGLLAYLKACGVRYFGRGDSAIWRLRDQAKAKSVGMGGVLIPPHYLWPWMALTLRVCDGCREAAGASVTLRNLLRPVSYEKLVATKSPRSKWTDKDHTAGSGADLVFGTLAQRRRAEAFVRGLAQVAPVLALSLGVSKAGRKMHVGVCSPRGSRCWGYGNFKPARLP